MSVTLECTPSPDNKTVRIKISRREYSSDDLGALIAGIAEIRERMQPPIPNAPDLLHAVRALADPRWYVGWDAMNDAIVLQLRVPGIGWIPSMIPRTEATKLRDLLNGLLEQANTPPAAH